MTYFVMFLVACLLSGIVGVAANIGLLLLGWLLGLLLGVVY